VTHGVQAGARLDRLPICGFHWRIFSLIGAGMFLDAFELYLTGGVLGALVSTGFSTMALNATFITVTFLGMVVGAWLAGVLGDRFGRRFSYQINLLLFGIASLAAFFAPDMRVLTALRFVMGLGLGAEIVVGYAALTEFVPPAQRGWWVTLLAVVTNMALFIASLMGTWIIPRFGWQYMFLIVGVAAIIVWLLRKSMPESPRWLESKGRLVEAEAVLARIEAEAARKAPLPPIVANPAVLDEPVGISILFSPAVLRRTLIGMMIHITTGLVVYGFIVWMPSFLVRSGQTVAASLTFTTIMSLGGPVGALIGMFTADRFGRRPVVAIASLAAALCGAVFPNVSDPTLVLMAAFGMVTGIYTMIAVGFALLVPEMFPTQYRFRGAGLCGTAGRLAAASVQYLVPWAFALGGLSLVVGIMSGVLALQGVLMFAFGIETRRKSLEVLAPANSEDHSHPVPSTS